MIAGQVIAVACFGCVAEEPKAAFQTTLMGPTDRASTLNLSPLRQVAPDSDSAKRVTATSRASIFSSAAALAPGPQAARLSAIDAAEPAPLRFAETDRWTAGVEFSASAERTGLGLDVSVAPRAVFEEQGRRSTARAGAEVRLGQNLVDSFDQRGKSANVASWYMFAGADGEALCWDVGDKGATLDGVALRDQLTIGDLQAGVAVQRGGGELSIGYVRREYSVRGANDQGFNTVDNFAAISFTMRR